MRALDNAIVEGMRGYLRRCENGGLDPDKAAEILKHVEAAADLRYFSIATMEMGLELLAIVQRFENKKEAE